MKRVRICPECKSTEVKRIMYGYPNHDFDYEKYEVGGCVVLDNSPKYKCTKCETTW
jgi:ribosomal protein L37AE/L43A